MRQNKKNENTNVKQLLVKNIFLFSRNLKWQHSGLGSNPLDGRVPFYVQFNYSPRAYVGFLWVLRLPTTKNI